MKKVCKMSEPSPLGAQRYREFGGDTYVNTVRKTYKMPPHLFVWGQLDRPDQREISIELASKVDLGSRGVDRIRFHINHTEVDDH